MADEHEPTRQRPPPPDPGSGRARLASGLGELSSAVIDRPTRRRAGVFRRALRREASRLRDPERIASIILLSVTFSIILAGLLARGDAAGADARAYWAGVRLWVDGANPYEPTGPFLPYVYAPWMLPLFAPWALLPWDVAWFAWRVGTLFALLWTFHWAYARRPLTTTLIVIVLAFPLAANLDTGNINLVLTLMLWVAQFVGPRLGGLLWALAAWMKWVPVLHWLLLAPRARLWGLGWLAVSVALSLITLPLTIIQLQTLFGFGARPVRLDFLVFLWAAIPWLYRRDEPFSWLRPSAWRAFASSGVARTRSTVGRWRQDPERTAGAIRRDVDRRVREFLGLGA